jgi:HK97 family phage major capsid protein
MGGRGGELRAILGDSGTSGGSVTIPTTVASTVYAYMTASVAMRRMNTTIITTQSGNQINFPKVSTHGVATQIATQNTAFAGTDPILTQMQLNAYDAGQLTAVSNDLLEDSGVDLLGFIGRQLGRSIGQLTAQWYVTGTGSSQPQGVMTLGGAGTVATGGSLILGPSGQVLEKLIDVQYSVADSYRVNGAEWLMRDLTGATIRKIRDGAGGTVGQFVWQPSPTVGLIGGQPDTFLGDPVYFDPNVASMASDAKVIAYGDFSAYYIRDVSGFRLERSDDLYFDKNQVAFRGLLRTDGDCIDANAINVLHQAVT